MTFEKCNYDGAVHNYEKGVQNEWDGIRYGRYIAPIVDPSLSHARAAGWYLADSEGSLAFVTWDYITIPLIQWDEETTYENEEDYFAAMDEYIQAELARINK